MRAHARHEMRMDRRNRAFLVRATRSRKREMLIQRVRMEKEGDISYSIVQEMRAHARHEMRMHSRNRAFLARATRSRKREMLFQRARMEKELEEVLRS